MLNCRQLLDLHGNAACCGTWQAEEICSITSSSSFLADADADADLWHPLLLLKEDRHGHSSLAFTFWTKNLHNFFLHTMQSYSLVRGCLLDHCCNMQGTKQTHFTTLFALFTCNIWMRLNIDILGPRFGEDCSEREMFWGVHSVRKCFFAAGPWNTWTICNIHLQHSDKWGTAAGRWDSCICNMQHAIYAICTCICILIIQYPLAFAY